MAAGQFGLSNLPTEIVSSQRTVHGFQSKTTTRNLENSMNSASQGSIQGPGDFICLSLHFFPLKQTQSKDSLPLTGQAQTSVTHSHTLSTWLLPVGTVSHSEVSSVRSASVEDALLLSAFCFLAPTLRKRNMTHNQQAHLIAELRRKGGNFIFKLHNIIHVLNKGLVARFFKLLSKHRSLTNVPLAFLCFQILML